MPERGDTAEQNVNSAAVFFLCISEQLERLSQNSVDSVVTMHAFDRQMDGQTPFSSLVHADISCST